MAWKIIDNELTNTDFILSPEFFETSAADVMWRIKDNEIETNIFIDSPELFETSAPAAVWRIQNNELSINTIEPLKLGAFTNATNLKTVSIPNSVKKIGRFSFSNTKIKTVKIADDCEYYSTSFPEDCVITGGTLIE